MKIKVNDIIINRHTHRKAMVSDIENDWAIPVYVIEYVDGGKLRVNERYLKHWELIG